MENAPVRVSSNVPPIALGKPAAIPAKIMIEMPLPKPRSVICSPSHIKNIVPEVKVVTEINRNCKPASSTRPDCDSSAMEIPNA